MPLYLNAIFFIVSVENLSFKSMLLPQLQAFDLSSKTPPRDAVSDKLVQPSPTINTKEALTLMQQMWGKSNRKLLYF